MKVKMKDYVTEFCKSFAGEPGCIIEFDIGLEPDMTVNDKSLNRVKFKITTGRAEEIK